ncbi:N,N-dimethylformamidase beta subunit family domain-containing protein [Paraburkholderia sp. PREW-6R]|uniref:N,N-dimethylformamidase beta subunit family domain-containing protein n=1 Tax=Paraburkholderia sp. PREW-6R TaxID=3141544 RepID=UPI0031F4BF50
MQLYPIHPSFTVGDCFDLAVQPRSRFSIAIYQQQGGESMVWVSSVIVAGTRDVAAKLSNGRYVFESTHERKAVRYDEDWNWPTITVKLDAQGLGSGAYAAVAFEVNADGEPRTEVGRRCMARQPIFATPPDSDGMALIIARPRGPAAKIAYIVPIATYHAYNSIGGGSFYGDPVHRTKPQTKVTLLRPGGGLGAQLGYPDDAYDLRSPRQHFTHWDAKFIRWLHAHDFACDFFTDVDLHRATDLDLTQYSVMLSVGHHEYWSQEMRDHVARFIANGGNLAVFSGNTCYRPVDFGPSADINAIRTMNRLGESWPGYNESDLIGLSYGYGGAKYGVWNRWRRKWLKPEREPIGFTVRRHDHWVFEGTQLKDGDTFGAEDRLVGYEADGVPPVANGFEKLADSVQLVGWDVGGFAALGVFKPDFGSGANGGQVFNCGTTDWSRVLLDERASSHAVVEQITLNVMHRFLAGMKEGAATESLPAGETGGALRNQLAQTNAENA